MPNRPLKRDELLKRLKPYGIVVLKRRGKGSEISGPAIGAILRRFKIDPDQFWK